ncbi:GFA family protein [Celerinatantimonas sp. YJH-8]|uniref:GFA family protein n=1 Tax=Celerinatantimonas sp. YJH-8 TaxID=3228714 RepID=UPI0038C37F6E
MLKGSCLCHSIQYEISGELGSPVMCHCSKCRKANGSAFAVNAVVKSNEFKITSGTAFISEFESTPGVFRLFCKKCGSPLVSRRPSQPEILRLRIGTLDTPIQLKPTAHIFVGSKAEWDEIHDELPQYEERPPLK